MIFNSEGYDGSQFREFYVAKSTNADGPGWFIYGRNSHKYGTFPDGRGRYVMLCGWRREGKARYYNGRVRIGWPRKRDAEAALAAHLAAHPLLPPAAMMAVPREPQSDTVRTLALSLHCYVSEDDASLPRHKFLELVRDRIELDLSTKEA